MPDLVEIVDVVIGLRGIEYCARVDPRSRVHQRGLHDVPLKGMKHIATKEEERERRSTPDCPF